MNQTAVRKWGNSFGIRIPRDILNKMELKTDDVLDVDIREGAIVLRKSFRHKTFEQRLAEYDGKISICEFEWGEPKGKEML